MLMGQGCVSSWLPIPMVSLDSATATRHIGDYDEVDGRRSFVFAGRTDIKAVIVAVIVAVLICVAVGAIVDDAKVK